MSKLFDTLEKIREHESSSQVRKDSRTYSQENTSKKPNMVLVTILLVAIIGVAIYGLVPDLTKRIKLKKRQVPAVTQVTKPSVTKSVPSSSSLPSRTKIIPAKTKNVTETRKQVSYADLNKIAIRNINTNQHWKGIYYLQKAIDLEPKRIEALVNVAVAFTELGLTWKAIDYFEKAHELNPNYEPLLQNLAILDRANLLESEILSSIQFENVSDPDLEVEQNED